MLSPFIINIDSFKPLEPPSKDLKDNYYRCENRIKDAKVQLGLALLYTPTGTPLSLRLKEIVDAINALKFEDPNVE
jgi:hypothetical protein